MPGAHTSCKPLSADASSASEEESQLELQLQKQLEEDVARIFDESLYSDLEVVCGKLKILTHSCILKARTNTFYHKLETILHVNIGRSTFDEIYSFISDAYTECNIKHQEKEIITYLDDNLNILKSIPKKTFKTKVDIDETEVFLTPKCKSPLTEIKCQKSMSSSPITELTKEYYALLPIEDNLLDKELIEQDALSDAFQSIIKAQAEDLNKVKFSHRNKPTSLSLSSSHTSKTVKHSNSCDILNKCRQKNIISTQIDKNNDNNVCLYTGRDLKNNLSESPKKFNQAGQNSYCEVDKVTDPAYTPDSLIADEPSSSSDYLSAAYTCSPGTSFSGCLPRLNIGDIIKMENVFTSSDSGLENTGPPESLSSNKDVTLTDVSLTESTLHDMITEDANESLSTPLAEKNQILNLRLDTSTLTIASDKDFCGERSNRSTKIKGCKSSKEEKQRQNEEIVILESSSLSSETGSWESVFPPKLPVQEICQQFINNECQYSNKETRENNHSEASRVVEESSLVQKSPFKSTSCFIDAACLMDEEDTLNVQKDIKEMSENIKSDMMPAPSRPVPCSTVKLDISPNDWSESNENEDSLEQADNKETDSIQKDLSPTIFDMTPITEDSLCTFETAAQTGENLSSNIVENNKTLSTTEKEVSVTVNTVFVLNTPHNSIMSLKASALKNYESEESESDSTIVGRENPSKMSKLKKYNESSPIVSGGASVEDHLPQISCQTGSPLTRRKIENIPIVSGAYISQINDINQRKSPKLSCASAWVVDMSSSPKSDIERNESSLTNTCYKRPGDRTCDSLRTESQNISFENHNKSRSSVDSDSSEKSSHKFYIDLKSLPDTVAHTNKENEKTSEKKNIFSMYIDIGDKSTLKEMPARLSSSFGSKKNTETKTVIKSCKSSKVASNPLFATENTQNSTKIFERYESLCNDPNISISEIIKFPEEFPTNSTDPKATYNADTKHFQNQFQEIRSTTVHGQSLSEQTNDLFVKLSDLDKPVPKVNTFLKINEEKILDVRMTRSIPENNWGEQGNSVASRSIEIISSFHSENALSLNRLFPHLKNEFSRSMPGSLSVRTRSPLRLGVSCSPGDNEEPASDMSEISSVQSSICRSVIENSTTEDTSQTSSLIGNCQSRLGQDLLRMFLEEIAPDVIVEVSGRRIKAHKCILSSRCQYFAGILSGGWVESAGNVIVLPPFSFNVVHFALCHIYSGVSTIPDSISIVELATIADMLGLEGLKEAIMFTLKAKYCHHFHRPCAVCTAGVLECFPLSSVYGLDDLYRKCLRWITKYFPKVWPTKAFATLPKELLDKCYQQLIVNLTIENFVDTIYGCGITVASLQNTRWAESVARMCRRLANAAAHYAAPRLVAVIRTIAPLPSDCPHPAKEALHNCLGVAIEWAPPDEACRAYAYLSDLVKEIRTQHYSKPDLITNGNQNKGPNVNNLLYAHASSWRQQCEGALVRAAPRVVGTQTFKELPADLRKRLRELGCIMYATQGLPVTSSPLQDRKTKSAYTSKSSKQVNSLTTRSLDIDHVRASFVPYAAKPAAVLGSLDILKSNSDLRDRKSTRANPPKIRTTKAQEERAKYNLTKNSSSQDRVNNKLTTARCSYEHTKPRYLEPRAPNKDGDRKMAPGKKLVPKMVSSSESSRNSSPIQARNLRVSRMRTRQAAETKAQAMSQDSLATSSRPRTAEPSTDSLSESQNSNKYATYTKTKHTSKGSVESIKSSKCIATSQNTVNKLKTKIPVYLNQSSKSNNTDFKTAKEPSKRPFVYKKTSNTDKGTITQPRNKTNDSKVAGSLMNATKSSSAKMVSKITSSTIATSTPKTSKSKRFVHTSRHQNHEKSADIPIPVMERSGTFLKDEPTFGDKTTNIDIDQ